MASRPSEGPIPFRVRDTTPLPGSQASGFVQHIRSPSRVDYRSVVDRFVGAVRIRYSKIGFLRRANSNGPKSPGTDRQKHGVQRSVGCPKRVLFPDDRDPESPEKTGLVGLVG